MSVSCLVQLENEQPLPSFLQLSIVSDYNRKWNPVIGDLQKKHPHQNFKFLKLWPPCFGYG